MGGKDIFLSASKCSSNIDLRVSGLKLMIPGLISFLFRQLDNIQIIRVRAKSFNLCALKTTFFCTN